MKKIMTFAVMALVLLAFLAGCGTKYEEGTLNGNVYENPVAGVRFTIPSSMTVVSPESIGVTGDDTVSIEFAAETQLGDNVALMVEKLPNSLISMDTYVDALVEGIEAGYSSDLTVTNIERDETVTYGGITFEKFMYTAEAYGVEMQQIYLLKKVDNRMMSFTFTLLDPAVYDECVKGFEAIG